MAGMGNVLHGDDGFGIEVARRLQRHPELPPEVSVVEVGIGGVPLVQDLLDGYEMLVIVDAVSKGKPPGTLVTLTPQVPDLSGTPWEEVGELLGDPHTTNPSRVLLIARALGALPDRVVIVGCEPQTYEELGLELSPPVTAAVPLAVDRVIALAREWLVQPATVSTEFPESPGSVQSWRKGSIDREDRVDQVDRVDRAKAREAR